MIPTNYSKKQRKLYRQARHQALLQMMVKQYSPFDADGNVVSETSPMDFKRYWASLTDTERAFEKLAQTDAAVFMDFHERVVNSIPKPPIAP